LYRYGFNGQEMSNEIKGEGNSYTAEFWEYDPRVGRRWNMDPKYIAGESRYAVNGNNPIIFTDPLGDFKTKFGAGLYSIFHGGSVGRDTKSGQYYVGQKVENSGDADITYRRMFDWNGRKSPYTGSGWGHDVRSLAASTLGVDGKAGSLFDMGMNSMLQNRSVQLTGDLLERVKQDPAVQGLENSIVNDVRSNSKYGNETFSQTYSRGVQLGGQRGSLNPLDASSAATWSVAANPLTWAVRSVNIQAQVQVSAEGAMSITYSFTDNFDLRPERDGKVFFGGSGNSPFSSQGGNRPWQYNAATSVLGLGYHDLFGGNDQMKVNATWTSER
jgi:RHS repeat-associated protein